MILGAKHLRRKCRRHLPAAKAVSPPARHDACGGGGLTYVFHARNTSTLQEAAESFGVPGGAGSSYVASGSTTGGGNTVTVSPSAWSLTPNVDVGGVTYDDLPASVAISWS